MIRSVLSLLNTLADGIIKGDWSLVLITLGICAVIAVIFLAMNNGNTGLPSGAIVVALMAFACLVLFKLSRNDDIHHPEKLVGHTYELTNSFVLAGPSEASISSYEREHSTRRRSSFFLTTKQSTTDKYGIVNLAQTSSGRWALQSNCKPTRLTVVRSGQANAELPLVEVRPENNAYAGCLYWIPARLIFEPSVTKAK
jgi:hypothetical protein